MCHPCEGCNTYAKPPSGKWNLLWLKRLGKNQGSLEAWMEWKFDMPMKKIAIKNCYTGNALQGMHYDEIAKNDLAGFHVTGKKGRREIHRTKYVR
jgi:hypothetical protein